MSRGDTVKDERGHLAVFSEQGTSAYQLAAAKALDAISRMPGDSGSDSDAVGAYTQVTLLEAHYLMGGTDADFIETWISFENMPHRRPKEWDNIEDPVCILRINLYGHPLAGLLWEKHCQKIFFQEGFEKVPSWECLYVHRREKLFLSIYVDDFKMAGKAKAVDKMWITLGKKLDLEPAVPVGQNTYLGCGQEEMHHRQA